MSALAVLVCLEFWLRERVGGRRAMVRCVLVLRRDQRGPRPKRRSVKLLLCGD